MSQNTNRLIATRHLLVTSQMFETTAEVMCPHCGETITLFLDLSVDEQTYIEDCSVCCQPMSVSYTAGEGELQSVQVEAE
jgi:hypothetical protein